MLKKSMIKKMIEENINKGNNKFVIYPFGENGLNVKNILFEYFGLLPELVVDDKYAEMNPNIISVKELREKYDDSMYIFLTVENNLVNMQMQKELTKFATREHIINLKAEEQNKVVEKKRTLLEYIADKSDQYRKSAQKLLGNNQNDIIKIYSLGELNGIDEICYSFVKDELHVETVDISDIKKIEGTILFFSPLFESYWTNILPLFQEYINRGKNCVVMFETIRNFWWTRENIDRMIYVMKEIKKVGGECILYDECADVPVRFKECFFCSEYSIDNPEVLRAFSNTLISVQTTGIYKHIYKNQTSIDQLYNELKCVDYYIGSDYICEWICTDHDEFRGKMLKTGYPKMDTLYRNLNGENIFPKDWIDVRGDKKVILLTMENPEKFVDIFQNYSDVCFVWRPDPEFIGTKSCNEKIQALKDKIQYLIIDQNRTYMNSFEISDAMIGMAIFCVPVNYLFTKKPLLLLDDELNMYNGWISMDYTGEAWYRSAYIADTKDKIKDFIDMVRAGRDDFAQEQKRYRNEMNKNFDGKVCSRIYQFLEA